MVLGSTRRRADTRRRDGTCGRDGTRRKGAALAAVAVLVLVPVAAACGNNSGGGAKASGTPTPSATAPANPAAAEQQVKKNWVEFFSPSTPVDEKLALLENGQQLKPVLEGFNGDKRGQEVSATVNQVAFTSPTTADVTYTLNLNGSPVLPGASGTSVEQGGTWKVSVKTLCALVQLNSNASASPVPGC
ncbi:hypothetical protein [Streptomyces sp. NPDC046821]|uniref:hypothetical protein n=1 Tax=Streptomyces sp. NPDC046821 TaxID=3154702 RepID=UPI0033FD0986